jgi:hypothetical protein
MVHKLRDVAPKTQVAQWSRNQTSRGFSEGNGGNN